MHTTKKILLATKKPLLAALFTAAAAGAAADQGAIDYRQAVFESIGGHMSGIVGVLKGEVPHAGDLGVHARGIADLAPLTLHIFPEDSADGRTKARAEIWENAEVFASRRQDFIDAATALGAVDASDMAAFGPAFRTLGGTCKGCHDDFKAE